MNHIFSRISLKDFLIFKIGLFFVPSAFSISSICILLSLFIQSFKRRNFFLKEKTNLILILLSLLMIFSSLFHTFLNNNYYEAEISKYLSKGKRGRSVQDAAAGPAGGERGEYRYI